MDNPTLTLKVQSLEERIARLEQLLQTKSKGSHFIVPSLEDVADYFLEKMPHATSEDAINFADVFISHYTNTGWKYGKNKMKDWKAAIRTWEQRQTPNKQFTSKEDEAINQLKQKYGQH